MKAQDIAYTEQLFTIDMNASLFSALRRMIRQNLYRITVVDSKRRVRGVLPSLRVLDVLAGRRGDGIKERRGKNLQDLWEEPVGFFIGGYLHELSKDMPLKGVISYIMENKVGHVVLTDRAETVQGVVTESCILNRLPMKEYGIQISEIMTSNVYTLGSQRTIRDAIELLSSHKIRRLPIMDGKEIGGLLTAKGILEHFVSPEFQQEDILSEEEVDRIMSKTLGSTGLKRPVTLSSDEDLVRLMQEMEGTEQRAYPIVDDEELEGIVTSRDMVSKLPKLMGIDEFLECIQN